MGAEKRAEERNVLVASATLNPCAAASDTFLAGTSRNGSPKIWLQNSLCTFTSHPEPQTLDLRPFPYTIINLYAKDCGCFLRDPRPVCSKNTGSPLPIRFSGRYTLTCNGSPTQFKMPNNNLLEPKTLNPQNPAKRTPHNHSNP